MPKERAAPYHLQSEAMQSPDTSRMGRPTEPIKVRLEKPFSISSQLVRQREIQSVDIDLEQVGHGKIWLARPPIGSDRPICTPAGAVEYRVRIDNDRAELVPESLPVVTIVELEDLTRDQLQTTACVLLLGHRRFEGEPSYDEAALQQDGRTKLYFDAWRDPKTNAPCHLYFPSDRRALSDIRLIFRKVA